MKYTDYYTVDKDFRDSYYGVRSDVTKKLFETDLWKRVIEKAVDDIIYYEALEIKQGKIKEEEKEFVREARSFLFNDNHKIHFDDYLVSVVCSICNETEEVYMSHLASGLEMCNNCSVMYSPEDTDQTIKEVTKEITLREILEMMVGFDGISYFRKIKEEEIEKGIRAKLNVK